MRSSLWFMPAVMVLGTVIISPGLIEAGSLIRRNVLRQWSNLFGASAEGAHNLLSAIAGSMITVAAVTLLLTILALPWRRLHHTARGGWHRGFSYISFITLPRPFKPVASSPPWQTKQSWWAVLLSPERVEDEPDETENVEQDIATRNECRRRNLWRHFESIMEVSEMRFCLRVTVASQLYDNQARPRFRPLQTWPLIQRWRNEIE